MSGSLSATPKYIYHGKSTAYREANKYDLVIQENRTAAAEEADNQTMHTSRYRLTTWDRRQGLDQVDTSQTLHISGFHHNPAERHPSTISCYNKKMQMNRASK